MRPALASAATPTTRTRVECRDLASCSIPYCSRMEFAIDGRVEDRAVGPQGLGWPLRRTQRGERLLDVVARPPSGRGRGRARIAGSFAHHAQAGAAGGGTHSRRRLSAAARLEAVALRCTLTPTPTLKPRGQMLTEKMRTTSHHRSAVGPAFIMLAIVESTRAAAARPTCASWILSLDPSPSLPETTTSNAFVDMPMVRPT